MNPSILRIREACFLNYWMNGKCNIIIEYITALEFTSLSSLHSRFHECERGVREIHFTQSIVLMIESMRRLDNSSVHVNLYYMKIHTQKRKKNLFWAIFKRKNNIFLESFNLSETRSFAAHAKLGMISPYFPCKVKWNWSSWWDERMGVERLKWSQIEKEEEEEIGVEREREA